MKPSTSSSTKSWSHCSISVIRHLPRNEFFFSVINLLSSFYPKASGFLHRNCTLFAPFIINGAILSLKYSVSGTKVRPLFFRVIQFSLWQGKSFCPQSSGHFQGDELMTSQCPPFLVPTRLSSFFSFRLVIFFSTAVVLMPILFAISVMLILGSCSASPRMLL